MALQVKPFDRIGDIAIVRRHSRSVPRPAFSNVGNRLIGVGASP
jgi:hypothetical protein